MRTFLKSIVCMVLFVSLAGCTGQQKVKNAESFSFGVIADIQYENREPVGDRYFRESVWKLEECVETFNSKDLAFVIQLGDFINHGAESFDKMFGIYNQLEAPKYHVLGNHDFPLPYPETLKRFGLKKGYYDFAVKGWRFIVLDGNQISACAYKKDEPEFEKAMSIYLKLKKEKTHEYADCNGSLGDEQFSWLKEKLKNADKAGEKVILFCHFPVYPENIHNLWGDSKLIAILESHDCVKAFMCGHNHAGNYAENKGIHYINFRGMVETPDQASYAVVNITEDGLEVIGLGNETTRILKNLKE